MNIPEVTQSNLRILLPAKIAGAAEYIANGFNCPPEKALMLFYQSKTYASLEKEETKYWHMSPLQLFREYCSETGE